MRVEINGSTEIEKFLLPDGRCSGVTVARHFISEPGISGIRISGGDIGRDCGMFYSFGKRRTKGEKTKNSEEEEEEVASSLSCTSVLR